MNVVVVGVPVCLARQCVRPQAVGVHPAVCVLVGTVSCWLHGESLCSIVLTPVASVVRSDMVWQVLVSLGR